jgi:hypothetical protein
MKKLVWLNSHARRLKKYWDILNTIENIYLFSIVLNKARVMRRSFVARRTSILIMLKFESVHDKKNELVKRSTNQKELIHSKCSDILPL